MKLRIHTLLLLSCLLLAACGGGDDFDADELKQIPAVPTRTTST